MSMVVSNVERACGFRPQGGLYMCVPTSEAGRPIEDFMLDPPFPWLAGPFRAPIYRQRKIGGIWDVFLWIGAENYPYVPDFIEEARTMGISKRVPTGGDADYAKLTPFQSKMFLVHPKAIYKNPYTLQTVLAGAVPLINRPSATPHMDCNHPLQRRRGETNCVFSLWDLSALGNTDKHKIEVWQGCDERHGGDMSTDAGVTITTPSVEYSVHYPHLPGTKMGEEPEYAPGVVAAFPLVHFEYVASSGTVPRKVADKLGDNINATFVTPT